MGLNFEKLQSKLTKTIKSETFKTLNAWLITNGIDPKEVEEKDLEALDAHYQKILSQIEK